MRVYLTNSQSTASNVSTFIDIEYLQLKRNGEGIQKTRRERIKLSLIQRTSVPFSTPGSLSKERGFELEVVSALVVLSPQFLVFTIILHIIGTTLLQVIILLCQWFRFFMLARTICWSIDRILKQSIKQQKHWCKLMRGQGCFWKNELSCRHTSTTENKHNHSRKQNARSLSRKKTCYTKIKLNAYTRLEKRNFLVHEGVKIFYLYQITHTHPRTSNSKWSTPKKGGIQDKSGSSGNSKSPNL